MTGEKENLLRDLAFSVERVILAQQKLSGGTQISGPLPSKGRLSKVLQLIQRVLQDGSLFTDFQGREECRTFVLNEQTEGCDLFGSASIEGWLQLQMSSQSLTQKLRDLYSHKERLRRHYKSDSISANPVLRQTFLLTLEALEQQDLAPLSALGLRRRMRRSRKDKEGPVSPRSTQLDLPDTEEVKEGESNIEKKTLQRTHSLPNLSCPEPAEKARRRGSFSVNYEEAVNDLNGDSTEKGLDELDHLDRDSEESPEKEVFKPVKGHQRTKSDTSVINFSLGQDDRDSVVTGSWTEIVPASVGWFPRPKANQSLVDFLAESSGDGVKKGRRAQLDRENAHFILSEAMISTFEQMNFERSWREYEEEKEESDEEIRELKQKLKKRRSQLKEIHTVVDGAQILSDGQTDTTTTDQSASPAYSSPEEESDTETAKLLDSNDEDFVESERRRPPHSVIPDGSAESIALSLLSRVGSGRLPPADQLTWLISKEEVDQDLLPLPSSLPVDPDCNYLEDATELRGTLTWAPPRPQIVLTVQDKPKSKTEAIRGQKWMCAGCGMKVDPKYSKSFRFCNYLGRYFCTGCHENQMTVIPARVIYHWDFKKYPVSNFSLDILQSMVKEPVFNIHHLNPFLLRKIEKLKHVSLARDQLTKLSRYVSACRLAIDLNVNIETTLVTDNEMYSLDDFAKTKSGVMGPVLRGVVSQGLDHVKQCELCQARAHICEGCRSNSSIFPFQTGVFECPECMTCYHKTCYVKKLKSNCVKCARRQLRRDMAPALC